MECERLCRRLPSYRSSSSSTSLDRATVERRGPRREDPCRALRSFATGDYDLGDEDGMRAREKADMCLRLKVRSQCAQSSWIRPDTVRTRDRRVPALRRQHSSELFQIRKCDLTTSMFAPTPLQGNESGREQCCAN